MVKVVVFLFLLVAVFANNLEANKLTVRGPNIIDQDGNVLVLKGVNLPGLEWDMSPGNNNITRETVMHISDDWGANVIRLPFNQDWYLNNEAYRNTIKNVHRWVTEEGMYLILDLHWVDEGGQTPLPNALSRNLWQMMARDFINADNVIYDIFNEPHSVPYSQWVGVANNLMQAVREIDPEAIFLIKGIDWGFSHEGQMQWDDSDNVIYGSHPYPNKTNHNGYRFLTGHRAILLSEFGYWTEGQQAPSGLSGGGPQYIAELLSHSNANGISYTAWCFHDEALPNLLSNRNTYARTAFGDQIRNDIRASTLRRFIDRTPLLVEAVTGERNKVKVVFSKNLDRQTATNISNYSISGYTVTAVDAPSYGDFVLLTLNRNLDYSTPASVSISNVRDITMGNNAVQSGSHQIEYRYYADNFFINAGVDDAPFEYGYSLSGYTLDSNVQSGVYSAGTYAVRTGDSAIDSSFMVYPWGITGYKINVRDNGNYRVLLAFFDQTGLGSRDTNSLIFNLIVNGEVREDSINYFLASRAYQRPRSPFFIRFDVEVENNLIDIDFQTITGRAFLAAVSVERNPSGFSSGFLEYGVLNSETVSVLQSASNDVQGEEILIYPNPFNPIANISFNIKYSSEAASISIYNVQGALVEKFDLAGFNIGWNTVVFNGSNHPSGVYFVRFENGDFVKMRRAVLLK